MEHWMNRRIISLVLFLMIIVLVSPPMSNAQSSNYYSIAFMELGLPNGTEWSITIAGTTLHTNNSSLTILVKNGSYQISIPSISGFSPTPNAFTAVVNGHNVSYSITWGPPEYSVTFRESGLPQGTIWNVTLGNRTAGSSNSTITFLEENGTYSYKIPVVSGINSSATGGSIVVSGDNVTIPVEFEVIVEFIFVEAGLPTGSHWSVFINGEYHNASLPIITMNLTNASYNYRISLPYGYSARGTTGSIGYDNNFVLIQATNTLLEYAVGIFLVMVFIVFPALYLMKRRSREAGK